MRTDFFSHSYDCMPQLYNLYREKNFCPIGTKCKPVISNYIIIYCAPLRENILKCSIMFHISRDFTGAIHFPLSDTFSSALLVKNHVTLWANNSQPIRTLENFTVGRETPHGEIRHYRCNFTVLSFSSCSDFFSCVLVCLRKKAKNSSKQKNKNKNESKGMK